MLANPCLALAHHPLAGEKESSIIDAGLEIIDMERCNIGIIPLLNRKVDCIFICDNSADYSGAPSLRAAEAFAKKNGLPFPRIPHDQLFTQEVTLIADDENLQAPILVYIPIVANENYSKKIGRPFDPHAPEYNALNFCYSVQQAEDLMGLAEYLVSNNYETFIKAVNSKIKKLPQTTINKFVDYYSPYSQAQRAEASIKCIQK